MRLIKDWRQAPKMYSVQALAIITALQGIGVYLSADQLAASIAIMPEWTWGGALHALTAFFGITGAIARLIDQKIDSISEEETK